MIEVDGIVVEANARRILKGVSMRVSAGVVHGLIGRNGAGKSTTVRTILGLQPLAQGSVRVFDVSMADQPLAYKRMLAYIPELPLLYQGLTVREQLQFTAMAYGVPENRFKTRLADLAERFEASSYLDELPINLSKGMKQKVNIMAAFIHDARAFIVDEPFNGLDPIAIRTLKDTLMAEAQKGSAILLTTHALDIAESLCAEYTVLEEGESIADGSKEALRLQAGLSADGSLEQAFMRLTGSTPTQSDWATGDGGSEA